MSQVKRQRGPDLMRMLRKNFFWKGTGGVKSEIFGQHLTNFTIVALIVSIIVARNPHIAVIPYLWAEDANIFLNRALTGISIGEPYAGYYHLIPELATMLSVCFSRFRGEIAYAPQFMYAFAVALEVCSFLYFVFGDFDWFLSGKWRRTCASFLTILFVPTMTLEVWYNVTNLQWWGELFIFFVGLVMVHRLDYVSSKCIVALFFIGMSTPACSLTLLIAATVTLTKVFSGRMRMRDAVYVGILALPVLIQFNAVLHAGNRVMMNSIATICSMLYTYCFSALPQNLFPGLAGIVGERGAGALALILFYGPLLLIFIRDKERRRDWLYTVLYMLVTAILFIVKSEKAALYTGRYSFCILTIWLLTVFSAIFRELEQKRSIKPVDLQRKFVAITIGICIAILPFKQIPLDTDLVDCWTITSQYYEESGKMCWIPVAPGYPWSVEIPVNLTEELQNTTDFSYSIDTFGGVAFSEVQNSKIELSSDGVLVSGWAVATHDSISPAIVFIEVNGRYVSALSMMPRQDVADFFDDQRALESGFICTIPTGYFIRIFYCWGK